MGLVFNFLRDWGWVVVVVLQFYNWFGVGCFGIVNFGCGGFCDVFPGKSWVGLGVGVSKCKINWVGVVVQVCG